MCAILDTYGRADAGVFFGRDEEIADGVDLLIYRLMRSATR